MLRVLFEKWFPLTASIDPNKCCLCSLWEDKRNILDLPSFATVVGTAQWLHRNGRGQCNRRFCRGICDSSQSASLVRILLRKKFKPFDNIGCCPRDGMCACHPCGCRWQRGQVKTYYWKPWGPSYIKRISSWWCHFACFSFVAECAFRFIRWWWWNGLCGLRKVVFGTSASVLRSTKRCHNHVARRCRRRSSVQRSSHISHVFFHIPQSEFSFCFANMMLTLPSN